MLAIDTDLRVSAESLASTETKLIGLRTSLAIFFLAGIPSLIYQVVWQRLLTLYFGVDIYSTTIAVTVFMLGLGIGSLIGGKIGDRVSAVSRLYAIVEVLIGGCGIASLYVLPMVGEAYAGSHVSTEIVIMGLLLLAPTILMGMTLPLMCCAVTTTESTIGPRLASLYGVNTLGAAIGALMTAYFLIGYLGLSGATWFAATLNLVLAILVFAFLPKMRGSKLIAFCDVQPVHAEDSQSTFDADLTYVAVLVCAFLSGFVALGYELAWYRVSAILMHGTVYVFGSVLFVFLVSLSLGSLASQKRIRKSGWAARFAWSQLGIASYACVFFSVLGYFSHLPGIRHVISASFFTPFHPSLDLVMGNLGLNSIYSALDIVIWTVSIITVPAFLMGYGFPNLMREGSQRVGDLGASISGIYFANILGSSLGGLTTGFLLIHFFGTGSTIKLMIVIGCLMSLLIFWGVRKGVSTPTKNTKLGLVASVLLLAFTLVLFPGKGRIIRALHLGGFSSVDLKIAENQSGIVALRTQKDIIAFKEENKIVDATLLYIDGSRHGTVGSEHQEDVEINIALAAHKGPLKVLVIGLGDSIMVSTLASHDRVKDLTVVELNSLLPEMTKETDRGKLIAENAHKVNIVCDDGRHWLQANPDEKFDFVMMWPLHSAQAYSGNVFSADFFNIIRKHLNKDGLVFFRSADPYSTARTVATVFDSTIRINSNCYLASDSDIEIDPLRTGFSREEIEALITADKDVILDNTVQAPLNTDYSPHSEYYITYPFTSYMRGDVESYRAAAGTMSGYVK